MSAYYFPSTDCDNYNGLRRSVLEGPEQQTNRFTKSAYNYHSDRYTSRCTKCMNPVGAFLGPRLQNLIIMLILKPGATLLDTIGGILTTLINGLSFRKLDKLEPLFHGMIRNTRFLVADFMMQFIKVINPRAMDDEFSKKREMRNGLLYAKVVPNLAKKAIKLGGSEYFFLREIASRFVWIAVIVSSVALRAIDFAIGLVAFIGSLITFGTSDKINYIAHAGLQITGIVSDTIVGLTMLLCPRFHAELEEDIS